MWYKKPISLLVALLVAWIVKKKFRILKGSSLIGITILAGHFPSKEQWVLKSSLNGSSLSGTSPSVRVIQPIKRSWRREPLDYKTPHRSVFYLLTSKFDFFFLTHEKKSIKTWNVQKTLKLFLWYHFFYDAHTY